MKAKEYCTKFGIPCNDRDKLIDALLDIAQLMVREIVTLVDTRKSKSPGTLKSIIKELDDKYQAVLRRCNLDTPDLNMFRECITKDFPEVAAYVYA